MTVAGKRMTIIVTLVADEYASPDEVGGYVFDLIGADDSELGDSLVYEIENYEVQVGERVESAKPIEPWTNSKTGHGADCGCVSCAASQEG